MKILEYEICYCKICRNEFSDEEASKKPHILKCGNTVCNSCMEKLTKEHKECFFDKTHSHYQEQAPVNFSFIDILKEFNELKEKEKEKEKDKEKK